MQIKERSFDNKSQDYDKIRIYHTDDTRKIPVFFSKSVCFWQNKQSTKEQQFVILQANMNFQT